jgi:serine protease AprX
MAIGKQCFLALITLTGVLHAQENRYMVFFKDKVGSAFSTTNPTQFLSHKSIARRNAQGIAVTEQDLPVVAAYVNQVNSTGARVLFSSRWFNAVLVEATAAELSAIETQSMIDHIAYVAPGKNGTGGRLQNNKRTHNEQPAVNSAQNNMLQLDAMHADGYSGNGMLMAVFDSGFAGVNTTTPFAHIFDQHKLVDAYNFAYNNANVFAYDDHGTEVLSVLAASIHANYTGGATEASYLLYVTEHVPTEYRVEEYYWTFAAERADSVGVDIISSSLGYSEFDDVAMDYTHADVDGNTAPISKAATWAFERGILVVNAAGNRFSSTWNRITPPADAANVLAVGAVDRFGRLASFSLPGPNANNQTKPDVVALGVGVSVINFQGNLSASNGTSFACPLVAALAAGVWQMEPQLTAGELLTVIRQSSSQYYMPDNSLGFGVPTYQGIKNIFDFPGNVSGIAVYPNPVQNNRLLVALAPVSGTTVNVNLYTMLGQPILQQSYTANWQVNPWAIDVSDVPAGVYIMRVETSGVKRTLRIIIP